MTSPILEARALSRHYPGGVRALEGVDLRIERGEFVSIIGRSGSGKSTLLNIVGGLDSPTGGSVAVNGTPLDFSDRRALISFRREMVGFVFQQFNLIPSLTARENVEYPLLFNYRPPAERQEKANALLAMVGLDGRASHYPGQLSGGEQQRVAIARALVADSPLVLADEPTGNLDSATSEGIFSLLQRLNRERRVTLLVVTHERELASYADRTVEMRDGRVVA
ncbi:MAG: putative ABC transporter ATP-binding protein [Methanoregulaceae archaeon PtaU1.Bin059]|nr:MAG: putative ABC transporter ATP-binding protein [Methanoregulaceae archaeon PtaB.Bin152]OPY43463.1 MAG: putative ABC transporter ATP-binding protein [Methanoregulaceae archaeon PtaU1.Bin059]